jgi:DNA-binding NarL/FixJ family response regulator
MQMEWRAGSSAMRLGMVEDNRRLADELSDALTREGRFQMCWRAETLAAALGHLDDEVDVLLLDLGLPDGKGESLVKDFRIAQPRLRIVAHTVFDSERQVMAALRAGVDGYLLKGASIEQVEDSLRAAFEGGTPLSPAVARFLLRHVRNGDSQAASRSAEHPHLTPRERDVLEHLARGYSYRETAASLGIGTHTVAHHAKNLYSKLAANSCSEAVFEALRSGLIQL